MVQSHAQNLNTPIAGRTGISPIGTSNQNSGATASTNANYGVGVFTSAVNVVDFEGSTTEYPLQDTDYQGLILFDTTSPVSVTLNSEVQENFVATILNIQSGAITLTPAAPVGDSVNPLYLVNGSTSLALPSGAGCIVAFAQRQWYAYVGATFIPVVPATFAAIPHEFLISYNASTGLFVAAQPAFSDISGSLATSQLPAAGISATIVTAKLTSGGTNGSMTFVNGLLAAQTPAT